MSLWWCPKCQTLVSGQTPGICATCGSATTYARLRS